MEWLTVIKTWIISIFRRILEFFGEEQKKNVVDKEEHIRSIVETMGTYRGKNYQIVYRVDLKDYWIGPIKRNYDGALPTFITNNLDEAIESFFQNENR